MKYDKTTLPSSWRMVRIGDLCDLKNGRAFKPEDWGAKGLPIVRIQNLNNPKAAFNHFDGEVRDRFIIDKGSLLFAWSGTPGTSFGAHIWRGERAVLNQHIFRVDFDERSLNKVYFMHAINDRLNELIEKAHGGVGLRHVTKGKFEETTIPVPPVREQHRIVAKIEELFSELDKGVESLTIARAQLKAYNQSVLKAAFEGKLTGNWRAENADKLEAGNALLGHIMQERERQYEVDLAEWREAVRAAEISGHDKPRKPSKPTVPDKPSPQQISLMGSLPPSWTWAQVGNFAFVTKLAGFEYTKFVKYDDAGDLEVIKAENAGPNGFRETEFSRIRSDTVAALERSQLSGGELLMVFVGAGTGNVATVPQGRSFFLGPNIGMMRVTSDRVNPFYVEQFLRSPHGRELVLSSVKAVAQPSLSMGTIRQIPVALPSLAEQSEIVRILESKLEAADVMDAEIDAAFARAEALRKSILKRAFSGQLVAQDAADETASGLLERIRAEREENGTPKRRNNKNNKKEAA